MVDIALSKYAKSTSEKFLQELAWGEFWAAVAERLDGDLWCDLEPYKTGFEADDYSDELPQDILDACTPNAAINHFIDDLVSSGYVHNHARMYLAAYVVHFRRVKWQAGAHWFMTTCSMRTSPRTIFPGNGLRAPLAQALYFQSRQCAEVLW